MILQDEKGLCDFVNVFAKKLNPKLRQVNVFDLGEKNQISFCFSSLKYHHGTFLPIKRQSCTARTD